MPHVKAVGVRDLKNQLSSHLREVKDGHRLLVTERGVVIAELRPPAAEDLSRGVSSAIDEWVNTGRLIPPRVSRAPLPASPVHLAAGTAKRLLDEERGD
jgi:antitoxin (DNA-binding transcriptional repressor) of toxin-antitoxin stability system